MLVFFFLIPFPCDKNLNFLLHVKKKKRKKSKYHFYFVVLKWVYWSLVAQTDKITNRQTYIHFDLYTQVATVHCHLILDLSWETISTMIPSKESIFEEWVQILHKFYKIILPLLRTLLCKWSIFLFLLLRSITNVLHQYVQHICIKKGMNYVYKNKF